MNERENLLVFHCGTRRCATPLGIVERVIRAVEVTPTVAISRAAIGVINVQGEIVPVLDLRRWPASAAYEADGGCGLEADDQFILVHANGRRLAIVAQSTQGVRSCQVDELTSCSGQPALIRLDDDVVTVYQPLQLAAALQGDEGAGLSDLAAPQREGR
jgi:chemotaxis signal transduction protein